MKRTEEYLAHQYKKESDELMFAGVEFDAAMQKRVKQQLAADGGKHDAADKRKTWFSKSKWAYGTAAAVLLLVVAVSVPQLGQPSISPPPGTVVVDPGASELSQLKTAVLQTPEEAKQRFGQGLLVPTALPQGFSMDNIEAVGAEEQTKTRVVFFYRAGDKEFTYSADRLQVVFPVEMFKQIEVNGVQGHIFAQTGMTELYWTKGGIHYAVVGMLTQEETMSVAASLQ